MSCRPAAVALIVLAVAGCLQPGAGPSSGRDPQEFVAEEPWRSLRLPDVGTHHFCSAIYWCWQPPADFAYAWPEPETYENGVKCTHMTRHDGSQSCFYAAPDMLLIQSARWQTHILARDLLIDMDRANGHANLSVADMPAWAISAGVPVPGDPSEYLAGDSPQVFYVSNDDWERGLWDFSPSIPKDGYDLVRFDYLRRDDVAEPYRAEIRIEMRAMRLLNGTEWVSELVLKPNAAPESFGPFVVQQSWDGDVQEAIMFVRGGLDGASFDLRVQNHTWMTRPAYPPDI